MNAYALIIEDDVDLAHIFALSFQEAGFEVDEASTGKKGLGFIAAAPPDVLILDLNLPDMSGFDILREVRRQYPRMTVIMITANHRAENSEEAHLADLFLYKPLDIQELITLAKRLRVQMT